MRFPRCWTSSLRSAAEADTKDISLGLRTLLEPFLLRFAFRLKRFGDMNEFNAALFVNYQCPVNLVIR
jgi:hypothetical protein